MSVSHIVQSVAVYVVDHDGQSRPSANCAAEMTALRHCTAAPRGSARVRPSQRATVPSGPVVTKLAAVGEKQTVRTAAVGVPRTGRADRRRRTGSRIDQLHRADVPASGGARRAARRVRRRRHRSCGCLSSRRPRPHDAPGLEVDQRPLSPGHELERVELSGCHRPVSRPALSGCPAPARRMHARWAPTSTGAPERLEGVAVDRSGVASSGDSDAATVGGVATVARV